MKDRNIRSLIDKYEAGESTREEEKFLFETIENTDASIEAWATFVKHHQNKAPNHLNESLWVQFQERRKSKKQKIFNWTISAAASILLIIVSTLFIQDKPNELSYSEKEALLNESMAMFTGMEEDESSQSIIYENEFFIIYTTEE